MKKVIRIILIISVLVFIVGFIPLFPHTFGLCEERFDSIRKCEAWYRDNLLPMARLTVISPIVFFVAFLRSLSSEVFNSWKKFAKYYLPIAAVLIVTDILFSSRGSGWGVSTNFDTELTTWWLAGIFFVVSLIIIAVKSWKLRKGK